VRKLEPKFMEDLQKGLLKPLLDEVQVDRDLALEIRENYINIYACGNSIPKVEPLGDGYRCTLHPRFVVEELGQPVGKVREDDETAEPGNKAEYVIFAWREKDDVDNYVKNIPLIKQRVAKHRATANEIEVEQLLMRTGSSEARERNKCNVEYIAIDRQIADVDTGGCIDVLGVFWSFTGRNKLDKQVPVCIIEIKHLLNNEIQEVHEQLWRYRELWHEDTNRIADEVESIASQKAELGLLRSQFATLRVNRDPLTAKFVVVLVDHNPHSDNMSILQSNATDFASQSEAKRAFIKQLEIFRVGYGLWRSQAGKLDL
jgi:hypothetical protein